MGRTLSRDELRTLLDQVTRDITNEAGVVLRPLDGGEQAPGEDLYTVYITFNRGINSRLALCELTARTLKHGLGLLGIQLPDRM